MENSVVHNEQIKNIPKSLSSTRLFSTLGTWNIPANTISFASVVVFLCIIAFFSHDDYTRQLFELPFSTDYPAVALALLCWFITCVSARRPGMWFPKIWVFFLSLFTSILAIALFVFPFVSKQLPFEPIAFIPLAHIMLVASFSAALVLLTRLIKIYPNTPWLQRIAPITMLLVLLLMLPGSYWISQQVVQKREADIQSWIDDLKSSRSKLDEVIEFDWKNVGKGVGISDAKPHLKLLQGLSFGKRLNQPELWEVAAKIHREQELIEIFKSVMDDLVKAMGLQVIPTMAQLSTPTYYYDDEKKRWKDNSKEMHQLATLVHDYHAAVTKALVSMNISNAHLSQHDELRTLQKHYDAQIKKAQASIKIIYNHRVGHWMSRYAPPQLLSKEVNPDASPTMLLQQRVFKLEHGAVTISFANVSAMMGVSYKEAKDFGEKTHGCFIPDYQKNSSRYFRLDCVSYMAKGNPPVVDVFTELRLVYKSKRSFVSESKPVELYYSFPVPNGTLASEYRDEIMNAFANAVKVQEVKRIKPLSTGGSLLEGFKVLSTPSLRVNKATIKPFVGERKYIVIRVVRSS